MSSSHPDRPSQPEDADTSQPRSGNRWEPAGTEAAGGQASGGVASGTEADRGEASGAHDASPPGAGSPQHRPPRSWGTRVTARRAGLAGAAVACVLAGGTGGLTAIRAARVVSTTGRRAPAAPPARAARRDRLSLARTGRWTPYSHGPRLRRQLVRQAAAATLWCALLLVTYW